MNRRAVLAGSLTAPIVLPAHSGVVDWFTGVKLGMSLPVFDTEWLTTAPSERRKLLLVDFWATWCAPCRKEFPRLNELAAGLGSVGLEVAGLTMESKEVAQAFLAKVDVRYKVGAGGTQPLQKALAIKALPYAILVDNNNKVVWRGQTSELNSADVDRMLKSAA